MHQLTKTEYELLSLVKNNPGINTCYMSRLRNEPNNVILGRMQPIVMALYVQIGFEPNAENYTLTAEGLQALLDYEINKRSNFWVIFEDRFWKTATLLISVVALIISFLSYYKSQATEQYVKIEIIRDIKATTIGAQSQNVSESRNLLEKNGIQEKK
ncbi:hypothetical protein [Phascolarctobacterium succinatutens]|uniref:hypothetical protein n=1 Tax=Phascolarctobacterium succinatutens TaxID=626940 RepID=UPI0025EEEB43|nr:hypothetical protein [Phascolarctobacterium succinatutens]